MTSLTDTLGFITSNADETDLDHILDGIKHRRKALQQVRAAAVRVGSAVKIDEISPKYLIGLTGTVTSIDRNRATVTLDEASTTMLRFKGRSRFSIADDQTAYPLTGVPLSCCHLSETVEVQA